MTSSIYEVLFFNHRRCFSLNLRYSIIYVNNFCFFLRLFSLSLVWFSWYIIFYITTTAPHYDVTMTSYPTQQNIEASSQLPAPPHPCYHYAVSLSVITMTSSLPSYQCNCYQFYWRSRQFIILSIFCKVLILFVCVRKYIWCSSKTLVSPAATALSTKLSFSLSNCNKFYINILYCL